MNTIFYVILILALITYVVKFNNASKQITTLKENEKALESGVFESSSKLKESKDLSEERREALSNLLKKKDILQENYQTLQNNYSKLYNKHQFSLYLLKLVATKFMNFVHFSGYESTALKLKKNTDKQGYLVFPMFKKEPADIKGEIVFPLTESGLAEYTNLNEIVRELETDTLIPPSNETIAKLSNFI